ncbi:MAG: hypothetical protein IKC72_06715, partial [Clostridia bacterium]|nr:hypothetical protein [Clostridia bacterium]
MRKHLKLWIALLTLALVFAVGFTVSALAADEPEALDPTSERYTPYGMIPTDVYETVKDYPFVAFDDKLNYIGASEILWNDGGSSNPHAIIHDVWKKDGKFFIYMRKDYSHKNSFNNIGAINCDVVIDLGGHTLTYEKIINGQLKYLNNNTRVTLKNGTMHAGVNDNFIKFVIYATDNARPSTFDFTFEDIIFTTCEGFAKTDWVVYCNPSETNANIEKGYKQFLTFRDCTFDMTNVQTKATYIATVGHKTAQTSVDVTLAGIHIEGDPTHFNYINQSYTEEVTITYEKGKDGYYATNTRPTDDTLPEHLAILNTPDGVQAIHQVISTDGTNTTYGTAQHDRLTPHGWIPADYADVDLYPFVAFNGTTGAFIAAESYLWTDGNKATATTPADPAAIIHKVYGSGTYYVYMRRNYTTTYGYFNMSSIQGHVIIDLQGHTLTYNKSASPQLKTKGRNSQITFRNGNLLAGGNVAFIEQQVLASADDRRMRFAFTFENITFNLPDSYSKSYWVSNLNPDRTNTFSEKGFYSDLTFTNCTFNTSNLARQIYIAYVGHKTGQVATNVTLSGVHINGPAARFNLIYKQYTEDVTVTYEKNENGHILTNTRPTSNAIPENLTLYDVFENPVALCKVLSTEGSNTTYGLDTHERLIPYGWIPADYYNNPTTYPILLFNDLTKTLVWGGNDWGNQNGTNGVLAQLSATSALNNENGRGVIYLQADQEDKATYTDENGTKIARDPYYNFGGVRGQHIVDLNGHTLTANSHVFFATNKDRTTDGYSSCRVFNGTINLQNYSLLILGSNAYSTVYSKVADFTFENVDIISNSRSNPIVADGIGANFITTYNISFKDCDFTLGQNYTGPMFNLGVTDTKNSTTDTGEVLTQSSKDITIHVFLEGGSVTQSANRMPVLYTNVGNMENKTFTLVEGENGITEIRTLNTFTTMLPEGYAFNGNTYIFDGKDDTYSYYRIALNHKYGLISPYLTDATKYPIVIFDTDAGYSVVGFDKWGGETNAEKNTVGGAAEYLRNKSAQNLVLFLQADLPNTTVYYNSGGMYGNKVVDLNGHTISLIDIFFHGEAKTKNQLDLVIKNGTFNVGAKKVLLACAVTSTSFDCSGRVMNVTFENVTFANIAKNGRIFEESANGSDRAIETNVRYVNCNYQINDGNNTPIIMHGTSQTTSPSHKVNISIEGGTFTYAGNLANIHSCQYAEAIASQQVVFKKYNDAYPTVTVVNGVDTASATYPAENGEDLGLRKTAQGETYTTYTMTPAGFVSAYLNLTNDLNFVYRVFVPAFYTAPVMTFTVGTSVVEVTECFVDENGYSCYRLPNINPARMGETISAS